MEMMTVMGTILLFGLILETLIEFIKDVSDKQALTWVLGASLLGIAISFNYDINLLASLGLVGKTGIFDTVLTGIAIGGGSNLIFDLFDMIKSVTEKNEEL